MTRNSEESVDSTSIGCELISNLVRANHFEGGVKYVARPAAMSPDTVKTWASFRRRPGFDQMFELMVYHDALFEEFIERRNSRKAECQK